MGRVLRGFGILSVAGVFGVCTALFLFGFALTNVSG